MELLKKANGNIVLTEEDKKDVIKKVTSGFESVLDGLRIDWRNDPHSKDTPTRLAKAYVNDLIVGCYTAEPKITTFPSDYDGVIFQGNIEVKSLCSHHHSPFIGVAHIAYIPGSDKQIIGLSKLNRIVEYYSRRPQVQEELTFQVFQHLNKIISNNQGIAIMISATHYCACLRGVKHNNCEMKTAKLSGAFIDDADKARDEFYYFINNLKKS